LGQDNAARDLAEALAVRLQPALHGILFHFAKRPAERSICSYASAAIGLLK
jgi:hypothetical protein